MARTSSVGLLITGDAKGAVKAVKLTEDQIEKLGKTTKAQQLLHSQTAKKIQAGFTSIARSAATWGTVAAGAAATVGVAMVKSGLSTVDALAKTSDKLGVATESLAKFRFAAEQTGVGTKTADIALQRFTRRLADAAAGTGPAVKAFEALGLSADELVKLKPDEAFARVADQMNKVQNSSQKVSLAFKLFDSEGVSLVNTLALGSEGLAAMAEEAEVLGLTLSRIDAKKVEEANDAWNRVRKAVSGFSQQLAIKVAPLLTGIADSMFGVAKEAGGMGEVANDAFDSMVKSAGFVADAMAGIGRTATTIGVVAIEGAKLVLRALDSIVRFVTNQPPILLVAKLLGLITGENYNYSNSDIARYIKALEVDVVNAANYIADVWGEPLPSDSIEKYVSNAERQYNSLAEVVVLGQKKGQEEIINTAQVTDALATTTEKAAVKVESAWSKALQGTVERIDTAFADAWQGAFDSFESFADSLKAGFEKLLAELAHLLITRPLIMNIGAAFGLGGASSAASAATIGAGGFSGLASFASTGFGGIGSAYQSAGMFLRDMGLEGLGNKSFNLGLDYANQGLGANLGQLGLNVGAGLLGGFAGNQVFGNTTGIGSAIGGIGGSIFGPLGTGVGAFLGSGFETLAGNVFGFGGKGGNQAGAAEFNLATGGLNAYGIGKSFDQQNVDTAAQLSLVLQQFSNILGGSDFSGRIKVGNRSGIKLDGTKYDSAEELFEAAFDAILDSADNLDDAMRRLIRGFEGTAEETMAFAQAVISLNDAAGINTVTQAIEDFSAAQPSVYRGFEQNTNALHNMIATFDGSAAAAVQLNSALIQNKAAAYEMAMAIQAIGAAISDQAAKQARDIRESVMSEEELRASRRAELNELRGNLGSMVDPELIAQTTERILELNRLIFDSLGPEAQAARAEDFASLAENVAAQAERRLDVSLTNLQNAQAEINQKISEMLADAAAAQQQAANTQAAAANVMARAVQAFAANIGREVNV